MLLSMGESDETSIIDNKGKFYKLIIDFPTILT
jgi:hypothetical protein